MGKFTALSIEKLTKTPGRYCDGEGLWLFVGSQTQASWIFRYSIDGVQQDMGEQLHQSATGKDPFNMDATTPQGRGFWKKAVARGGGFGLLGDFIFSDLNRYGGSLAETAAGLVGFELDKAIGLTVGNAQELAADGEAKNAGRELKDFARLMQPGRSLWYTNLAMDRLVWDEVQMQLDPNYGDSFKRAEDRALNETGQEYFSPPGSGFPPPRAPNLGAAIQ